MTVKKTIKILDEHKHIAVNYTCLSDYFDLEFVLEDYTIQTGDTVKLYVRRPDGEMKEIAGTKDLAENSVRFNVPADFFPLSGKSTGQIGIYNETGKAHSNLIILRIHPYYGGA